MNAAPHSPPRRVDFELRLTDAEFRDLAALVEGQLGIRLPPEKRPLVTRRLRDPVAASGHPSYASWAAHHLRAPTAETLSLLADALTTNHTAFWREPAHFEHLRDHALPERLAVQRGSRDLRLWCAASATGEEPYQLAMILRDAVDPTWAAGLLATDVSARALAAARAGTYDLDRLDALPAEWRSKYLVAGPRSATMAPALRRDITFRRLNLLTESWPFRKPFDVIFCRNVLIYFDPPTRDRVVGRLVRWLQPGGWLYLGHAEGLPGHAWPIVPAGAGIWKKEGSP